ncbi:hypothetical protein ACFSVK_00025 [Azorhizophilus paspali]
MIQAGGQVDPFQTPELAEASSMISASSRISLCVKECVMIG